MKTSKVIPSRFLSKTTLIVAVILFAVIGSIVVILVRGATTPPLAVEPELGATSNGASVITDSTASNGQAVKFGAQLPPAPPPPPPVGTNPYGIADYCTLEGTNTVIYGWASDPNAAATSEPSVTVVIDGKSVTVPTNVAGYRDAPINSYIANNYPGDPTPGTYGFKAVAGTFAKGANHPISGTIINIGAGANAVMGINKGGILDGDPSKISFVGGVIPDQCLGGAGGPAITKACGDRTAPPAKYDHVIWIMNENREFPSVIGSANAPYMTSLAKMCGTTSKYYDAEPSSEENGAGSAFGYHSSIAYVSPIAGSSCLYGNGSHGTNCWYSLSSSARNNLPWRSLFKQVVDAGGTWRQYDESAPGNCSEAGDTTLFHEIHHPANNFADISATCATNSIAIPGISCVDGSSACSTPNNRLSTDIANGTLATFSVLIPNVRNNMHGDGVSSTDGNGLIYQGDLWVKAYLSRLFASAEYKKGRTAVFVIWDEPRSNTGMLPFLAISPSTKTGTITTPVNHFAVLRATEEMLGINEYLGCASGAVPKPVGGAAPAGSSCFTGATAKVRTLFNM